MTVIHYSLTQSVTGQASGTSGPSPANPTQCVVDRGVYMRMLPYIMGSGIVRLQEEVQVDGQCWLAQCEWVCLCEIYISSIYHLLWSEQHSWISVKSSQTMLPEGLCPVFTIRLNTESLRGHWSCLLAVISLLVYYGAGSVSNSLYGFYQVNLAPALSFKFDFWPFFKTESLSAWWHYNSTDVVYVLQ